MHEWFSNYQHNVTESGYISGLYVCHAISANFAKKRYPEEPIQFYKEPVHGYEEDEEEQEQLPIDVERFKAFAIIFNKQFNDRNMVDDDVVVDVPDGNAKSEDVNGEDG